ncbi:hypothetical protein [Methanolapillus millepedarum]|uniref:Uncharacterized protein n=1 Tax=Methanolapillus millepedarum TaxID=3028296 RepID=A0AA96V4L6_9EURY|nr:hypothetical protein MsAc7_14040 [Methanosarcinaceae archaeon Ac7]
MTQKNLLIAVFVCVLLLLSFFAGYALANSESLNAPSQKQTAGSSVSSNPVATVISNITFMIYTPPGSLTEQSDLIVFGKVADVHESKWTTVDGKQPENVTVSNSTDENGNPILVVQSIDSKGNVIEGLGPFPTDTIYTDIVFSIENVYKGTSNSNEIIIRLPGGTVDQIQQYYIDGLNPDDFSKGDELFLYLAEDDGLHKDIGPEHYVIITPWGKLNHRGDIFYNEEIRVYKEGYLLSLINGTQYQWVEEHGWYGR